MFETGNSEVTTDDNQQIFFNDKSGNDFLCISYIIENGKFLGEIVNSEIETSQIILEYYVINLYFIYYTDMYYFNQGISEIKIPSYKEYIAKIIYQEEKYP